jgi:hypothetical protein
MWMARIKNDYFVTEIGGQKPILTSDFIAAQIKQDLDQLAFKHFFVHNVAASRGEASAISGYSNYLKNEWVRHFAMEDWRKVQENQIKTNKQPNNTMNQRKVDINRVTDKILSRVKVVSRHPRLMTHFYENGAELGVMFRLNYGGHSQYTACLWSPLWTKLSGCTERR